VDMLGELPGHVHRNKEEKKTSVLVWLGTRG
jgi:hypothetical protein